MPTNTATALPAPIRRNEALRKTIDKFNLSQSDLCRKSLIYDEMGLGKKFNAAQLCRYLKGEKDLYAEALATLEMVLPDTARAYYRSLVEESERKLEQRIIQIASYARGLHLDAAS